MCAEVDRDIFRSSPLAVVRDDGRPMRLECCESEVCYSASLSEMSNLLILMLLSQVDQAGTNVKYCREMRGHLVSDP